MTPEAQQAAVAHPDSMTHFLRALIVAAKTVCMKRHLHMRQAFSEFNCIGVQAVNKLAGTCFSTADEANLELFGVHLGNTLTKSRLYASIM